MAKEKKSKKESKKESKKKKVDLANISVEDGPAFAPFADGEWYPAKLNGAEIREGQYGEYILIKYDILGGFLDDGETEAKGRSGIQFCNDQCYPGSKLWLAIKGLSGSDPEEGDDIDLTAYYGVNCEVHFENTVGKDKSINSNINKVRVAKTEKKKKKKKKSKK
jgi:hypothetical protein